jgi:hypothetical protein
MASPENFVENERKEQPFVRTKEEITSAAIFVVLTVWPMKYLNIVKFVVPSRLIFLRRGGGGVEKRLVFVRANT